MAERITEVHRLLPVEPDVTQSLPAFPALVAACEIFETRTVPQLSGTSSAVETYCAKEVGGFQRVITLLQGEHGGVPPAVASALKGALEDLAASTRGLVVKTSGLGSGVRDFADANAAVDAQVQQSAGGLGGLGASVAAQSAAAAAAAESVEGVWGALADDLGALTVPNLVTSSFIDDLALQVAVATWRRLQQEAGSFASSFPFPRKDSDHALKDA